MKKPRLIEGLHEPNDGLDVVGVELKLLLLLDNEGEFLVTDEISDPLLSLAFQQFRAQEECEAEGLPFFWLQGHHPQFFENLIPLLEI